jgi:HEAT repeat protein
MRQVVIVTVSLMGLFLLLLIAGGIPEWLGVHRIERNNERMAIFRDQAKRNPPEPKALNALISAVNSTDSFERTAAIAYLGQVGSNAAPAVKTLIGALNSQDPYDAREAANTLSEIGPSATQAVPDLINAVKNHPNEDIGWFAAGALGYISNSNDLEVVRILSQATKSSDERMRNSANQALSSLGVKTNVQAN